MSFHLQNDSFLLCGEGFAIYIRHVENRNWVDEMGRDPFILFSRFNISCPFGFLSSTFTLVLVKEHNITRGGLTTGTNRTINLKVSSDHRLVSTSNTSVEDWTFLTDDWVFGVGNYLPRRMFSTNLVHWFFVSAPLLGKRYMTLQKTIMVVDFKVSLYILIIKKFQVTHFS